MLIDITNLVRQMQLNVFAERVYSLHGQAFSLVASMISQYMYRMMSHRH